MHRHARRRPVHAAAPCAPPSTVRSEGGTASGRQSPCERTPVLGQRRRPRGGDELGGVADAADAADAETDGGAGGEAGAGGVAATQRSMQRTLRTLVDTQRQTAAQLATLTSALASMQQGPPQPQPQPQPQPPQPQPQPQPPQTQTQTPQTQTQTQLQTPQLSPPPPTPPHAGTTGARSVGGTDRQNCSSRRRQTAPQSPAASELPLIELETETEPPGLYGSLSL